MSIHYGTDLGDSQVHTATIQSKNQGLTYTVRFFACIPDFTAFDQSLTLSQSFDGKSRLGAFSEKDRHDLTLRLISGFRFPPTYPDYLDPTIIVEQVKTIGLEEYATLEPWLEWIPGFGLGISGSIPPVHLSCPFKDRAGRFINLADVGVVGSGPADLGICDGKENPGDIAVCLEPLYTPGELEERAGYWARFMDEIEVELEFCHQAPEMDAWLDHGVSSWVPMRKFVDD